MFTLKWPSKHRAKEDLYSLDWTAHLKDDDGNVGAIVDYSFSLVDGDTSELEIVDTSLSGNITTVVLAGGRPGETATIVAMVTTDSGRKLAVDIALRIF